MSTLQICETDSWERRRRSKHLSVNCGSIIIKIFQNIFNKVIKSEQKRTLLKEKHNIKLALVLSKLSNLTFPIATVKMSIEELQKDSEELAQLLASCTRKNVRESLTKLKAEVDREISVLELKARIAEERKHETIHKRYFTELNEYAWDQSDKFVKLFVTLEGVQSIDEKNVAITFTEHSMKLLVSDLNGKDYGLTVNNLLFPIIEEKSYRKVKNGLVAIYMKKKDEGKNWSHLTQIEKRLKDKQDDDIKSGSGAGEDALVNIMKKMYNSGDSKTKQMIAKAWVESQEKARTTGMMPNDLNMDL